MYDIDFKKTKKRFKRYKKKLDLLFAVITIIFIIVPIAILDSIIDNTFLVIVVAIILAGIITLATAYISNTTEGKINKPILEELDLLYNNFTQNNNAEEFYNELLSLKDKINHPDSEKFWIFYYATAICGLGDVEKSIEILKNLQNIIDEIDIELKERVSQSIKDYEDKS